MASLPPLAMECSTANERMPDRFLEELRATLARGIPVCAKMGFDVRAYDQQQLTLAAPLHLNRNHQDTAFAGSLNALCTIAGWGRVLLLVRQHGMRGDIVIRRSAIRYLKPIESSDILAQTLPISAADEQYFLEMLRAKRQAKIEIRVHIPPGDVPFVSFHGSYVVTQRD